MDHVSLIDEMLSRRQHSDLQRASLPFHHVSQNNGVPPRFTTFSASQSSPAVRPPPTKSRSYSPIHIHGHPGRDMSALTSHTPGPPPADVQVPAHALFTPSGRALAIGGRLRNVATGPAEPCIMFWPDNEPLPDPGQIRPPNHNGFHQPPILNTGNRGPICHQPGDWICRKCNYLNWRRRKVCQTCFPYAEGNGDSVSFSVKSALLYSAANRPIQHSPVDDSFGHPYTAPANPRLSPNRFHSDSGAYLSRRPEPHFDSDTFGLERLSLITGSQIYETPLAHRVNDSRTSLTSSPLSSVSTPYRESFLPSSRHVIHLPQPTSPARPRFFSGDSYSAPGSHSEHSTPSSGSFELTPVDYDHQLTLETPRQVDYPAPNMNMNIWKFGYQDSDKDLISAFPPVPAIKDFDLEWSMIPPQVRSKV